MPIPTARAKLPLASFDGVEYPLESQKIKGGVRVHVHEYPHAPGGAVEKMGRSLYRITHQASFQDTFLKYPGLYPQRLNALRVKFEEETTATLSVPGLGTIKALCTSWDRDMVAKIASGERVTFEFLEDMPSTATIEALVDPTPKALEDRGRELARQLELVRADLARDEDRSLLQRVQDSVDGARAAISSVVAIRDQADMYSGLLEAKLREVARHSRTLSDTLRSPKFFRMQDAAHEVWAASLKRVQDLGNRRVQLNEIVLPMTMALAQVSSLIFGDATHGDDVMALNPVPDPHRIPAGTTIRFYPLAA